MPEEENTFEKIDAARHDNEGDQKVILLSGFSDKQLHDVIDAYRSNKKLPKTIFATVTEQSKEFKVKELLEELKLELAQIQAAKKKVRASGPDVL